MKFDSPAINNELYKPITRPKRSWTPRLDAHLMPRTY